MTGLFWTFSILINVLMILSVKILFLSSAFGRASTPSQTQTGLGPEFILLLPQAAVLPGSDGGTDGVKPASSFVIQNRQTSCSVWCSIYGNVIRTCPRFVLRRCTRNWVKKRDAICAWTNAIA